MNRRKLSGLLLAATLVCGITTFATPGTPVHGNPKSKVYHETSCAHYSAKGSSEEFTSAAKAKEAGYKPCRICSKPKAAGKEPSSGKKK